MQSKTQGKRIAAAVVIVLAVVVYLAVTGVRANKSYYVTIQQLHAMGQKAYTRHLRVAGTVLPGSIHRSGTDVSFVLKGNADTLHVSYVGQDPPPDTFKNDSMTLAIGRYGHDGVFHANQLQSKCASKYAPAAPASAKPGIPTQTAMANVPARAAAK